jgi:hypothetical protein
MGQAGLPVVISVGTNMPAMSACGPDSGRNRASSEAQRLSEPSALVRGGHARVLVLENAGIVAAAASGSPSAIKASTCPRSESLHEYALRSGYPKARICRCRRAPTGITRPGPACAVCFSAAPGQSFTNCRTRYLS